MPIGDIYIKANPKDQIKLIGEVLTRNRFEFGGKCPLEQHSKKIFQSPKLVNSIG